MGLQDMIDGVLGTSRGKGLSDADREQKAKELAEKCGYAAAALTIFPIPLSEVVAVMPLHVGMVVATGTIYDVDVTRDSANQLILRIGATVGLSLIGSRIATTAAKVMEICARQPAPGSARSFADCAPAWPARGHPLY